MLVRIIECPNIIHGQNSIRGDSIMQMKWKKTGAALLVATMTVTGGSYAWANENLFDTVNVNDVLKENEKAQEKTTEVSTGDTVKAVVTTGDSVKLDIKIPEGYTAGNLEALSKAYENAGSETAKAAIKRNAERAIAKFEATQEEVEAPKQEEPKKEEPKVETPKTEEPKVEEPKTEVPVVEAPVKEEPKELSNKEQRKALQEEQKQERKALQADHKEERKALKAEQKAEKQENKNNKKDEKNKEDK